MKQASAAATGIPRTLLPLIAAHPLERRMSPFDDLDWLFEVKADGFRSLLYIVDGEGCLVSRSGREMKRFGTLATALAKKLKVDDAILDGEIVTKDATGRPIFLDLLRREGEASYIAFDVLWLDGRNLRALPLTERKRRLRRLMRTRSKLIKEPLYVPGRGRDLFNVVCQHDLEGIVAKRKGDAYVPSSRWIKIKNPSYSQVEGRGELFNGSGR